MAVAKVGHTWSDPFHLNAPSTRRTHWSTLAGPDGGGPDGERPEPSGGSGPEPMVPASFSDFFAASAGVAGALIGLLFVAISVAPAATLPDHRLDLDIRAGVALSALTDALVVSLFALIPGIDLAVPAMVAAATGFASCVALGIVLIRAKSVSRHSQLRLLTIQAAVFIYQLVVGIQLLDDPGRESQVRTLAVLTTVFFLIGIARAWQLIGARDTGLLRTVGEVLRTRSSSANDGATTSEAPGHLGP
jgi:hypothetical protein